MYWTKFECISSKILTKATNRTLRVRGVFGLNRTLRLRLGRARGLARAKPKNFPSFFSFFGGGCGGSRQKMERKFLVLLRSFSLRKEQPNYDTFVCSFLHLRGNPRRFLSAFGGSSKLCGFVTNPPISPRPSQFETLTYLPVFFREYREYRKISNLYTFLYILCRLRNCEADY